MSFREQCWTGVVFFASYFFYLITLYPAVATEDAGEFTTAVATLGVAHPPGYPLYILLGKMFTLLIPFGNLAWKVNLFSAFCGAVSAVIFFLCLKLFTRNDILSFCGALVFTAGSIFWSQSLRAEVYTLNSVFFLLIMYLLFLWREKLREFTKAESQNFILLIVFLYGLGLGNHYLMFLGGIPFALLVLLSVPAFIKDWKFWGKAVVFFLLGLGVYLYLPLRASMHPALNWGDPSTWENFWNHVTRKLYSSSSVDAAMNLQTGAKQSPELFSGWWFDDVSRYHVWQMFWYVVQHFVEDYFWGLLVFVPFGLAWFWKKAKVYFWFFTALFVFYSFVLSKLLGLGYVGRLPVDLFKDRPFYIPVLTILCFLAAAGVHGASQKLLKENSRRNAQKMGALFLGAVAVFHLIAGFPRQNQSHNYVANDLARLIFNILPENSVYFVQNSDNTLFPVLYLNKVEGLRSDVKFYIPSPISVYNFFTTFEDLQAQNPGRRIFTDFPFAEYAGKAYDYYGPVSEIVSVQDFSRQKKMLAPLESVDIRGLGAPNLDHYNTYLAGRFLLDVALVYGGIDDQKQGELFHLAAVTAPESVNIFSQLIGNYYVRRGLFAQALPFLTKAYEFYPNEYSVNFELFLSYLLTNDVQQALPYFSKLARTQGNLFLRDYEQMKILFPNNGPEFENFEKLLKKNNQSSKMLY